jgi:hypothetical protein
LSRISNVILNTASENEEALLNYGIDAEDIAKLRNCIAGYKTSSTDKSGSGTESKVITKTLKELFRKCVIGGLGYHFVIVSVQRLTDVVSEPYCGLVVLSMNLTEPPLPELSIFGPGFSRLASITAEHDEIPLSGCGKELVKILKGVHWKQL